MTILLVDAGNSRLKFSCINAAGEMPATQAYAYAKRPALEVFAGLLDEYPQLERLTLVHVLTPVFEDAVQAMCRQRAISLHCVRSLAQGYGVTSGYRNPAALGADRFVGLVAAHHQFVGRACLVIDCGTAVTVDAMDAHGRHQGGLILPGLQLAADALLARAQKRMPCTWDAPAVFAADTAEAVGGGCLFGLAGAIEGICERMQASLPVTPLRLLTGGDAERLHPHLRGEYRLCPELLMQGLQVITEQETCTSC